MGDIHPRFRTPHRAIVLQGIWASVLVWSGTYRQLFTRVIFTEWIFFAMMAGGIFLLRRRPGYAPAYRVWGYPWVPAVFVIASVTIVVNRLISEPADSAAGLAIVGLGVPALPAAGQKIGLATSLQRGYAGIKTNFTAAAEKMPDADYAFKVGSMPEARTYGQLIAHIAQSQFGQCSGLTGVANPMAGKNLEQELKTKAELTKALADSFALCDKAFADVTLTRTRRRW